METSLVDAGQPGHPDDVRDGADSVTSEKFAVRCFGRSTTKTRGARQQQNAAAPVWAADEVSFCAPAFTAIEVSALPACTSLRVAKTIIRKRRQSGSFLVGITAGATVDGSHVVSPTTILALLKAGLHCHIASEAMSPAELRQYVAAIAPRPRETQLVCFDAQDVAVISLGRIGWHVRIDRGDTASHIAHMAARLQQRAVMRPVAAFADLHTNSLPSADDFISALRVGFRHAGAEEIDIVFAATASADAGGTSGELVLFADPERRSRWPLPRQRSAPRR